MAKRSLGPENVNTEPRKNDRSTQGKSSTKLMSSFRVHPQPTDQAKRLLEQWKPEFLSHISELTLAPNSGEQGILFEASGFQVGDVVYVKNYSESVSGISGMEDSHDPTVIQFVSSGWIRFESQSEAFTVGPGQMCIRDTRIPWRFWHGPGTRHRWIATPRATVVSLLRTPNLLKPAFASKISTPEAKFLLSFTEMANELNLEEQSQSGRIAIGQAVTDLLAGVISGISGAGSSDFESATLHTARKMIDHSLTESGLSPSTIAQRMHISLRTLHRCFAAVDDSVMGYVRRRRLEEAHTMMVKSRGNAKVSEIAERWNFSDSSHFIRQYKEYYGITPAATLRSLREKTAR